MAVTAVCGLGLGDEGGKPAAAAPQSERQPTTASASAPATRPAGGEPKWHPGHYAFVQSSPLNEGHIYKHFLGVQKMYNWSLLEPKKDQYDFSAIREDLAFLEKHGKRLVIQVQTKAFGAGQNCCPAYLSGADYGGGVYKTRWGSFNPMIWDERVNRRLTALYKELGKALDSENCLEAVVIPETAITGDVASQGDAKYSDEAYRRAIEDGMTAARDAFPNTVVIQYVNMPLELIQPAAAYAKAHGVGFGGPDIYPFDPLLTDPNKGVYRLYAPLSGIVPLGAAVQQNDYSQKAAFRGEPGEPTVKEIYEFGRDKLRLNYIFWGVRKGYFEKVQAMMDAPAFPADAAGGLSSKVPSSLNPPAATTKRAEP